jgi:hypothetical protein
MSVGGDIFRQKTKENEMNSNSIAKLWRGAAARITVRAMLAGTVVLALTGIAISQSNTGDNYDNPQPTVKFKGAIGVIPVTGVAANGTVNLNVVRGVSPGAPWRIASLEATVSADGHIRVVGRGLLLATGNGIGTNAGQSVHASLFCGPAATATEHDTNLAGVALAANGDFTINDFLSPLPPSTCESPVLLIRNAGGVWFAAGIPDFKAHQ